MRAIKEKRVQTLLRLPVDVKKRAEEAWQASRYKSFNEFSIAMYERTIKDSNLDTEADRKPIAA